MEGKLKHLEFIQAVVTRLAGNSFLIKGWTVTLVAALFALGAKESNPSFTALAYFPCILFWGLDGYYLSKERQFRRLYDAVRAKTSPIDFDMNVEPVSKTGDWIRATFSVTIWPFFGVIAAAILAVMKL
jgi:hypothetical protein